MGVEDFTCDRCNKKPETHLVGSWFDMDMICEDCEDKEKQHPRFKEAKAAENKEVRRGNMNFPGIGLPDDLRNK